MPVSQLCTAKDGNGNKTAYWYDGYGNMTKIVAPNPLGVRTIYYDSLGRVSGVTNGRGQSIDYTYDGLDHVISMHVHGEGNPLGDYTVTYVYDVDSNLTDNTDAAISYDAQNRQTGLKDQAVRDSANGITVTYDAAGNVASKTDETGAVTKYTYDPANQLQVITAPGASCTNDATAATPSSQAGCVKFTRDANDREIKRTLPGTVTQTTNYNAKGQLISIWGKSTSTWLGDFPYGYTGPDGKQHPRVATTRTISHTSTDTAKDTYATTSTTTYSYDSLNRLTKAAETGAATGPATWTYGYDKNGNLTNRTITGEATALGTVPAGAHSFTYNAADQISAKDGDTNAYHYDADGNETAAPDGLAAWVTPRSTTWSAQDQTIEMTTPAGAYHYTTENANPGQTGQLWEAHGGTIRRSPLGIDSITNSDGVTARYITTPAGAPVAYTINGNWNSLITDKLGSVRAIASANGGLAGEYTYDPYGGFRTVAEYTDDAHNNTIQYTGAILDPATGLYRMGVRWYDPGLGRFTNPDPSTKETNPYLYAAGNPINGIDPLGTSQFVVGASYCFIVCASISYQHPHLSLTAGPFGFGGRGIYAGWASGEASSGWSSSASAGFGALETIGGSYNLDGSSWEYDGGLGGGFWIGQTLTRTF